MARELVEVVADTRQLRIGLLARGLLCRRDDRRILDQRADQGGFAETGGVGLPVQQSAGFGRHAHAELRAGAADLGGSGTGCVIGHGSSPSIPKIDRYV